jgi:hypothetical protein
MKIHSIWDNKGASFDQYTVCYDETEVTSMVDGPADTLFCVGMSEHPFHPQGFGQHSSAIPGEHLGKRIKFTDLPEDCQKLIIQDLENDPDTYADLHRDITVTFPIGELSKTKLEKIIKFLNNAGASDITMMTYNIEHERLDLSEVEKILVTRKLGEETDG